MYGQTETAAIATFGRYEDRPGSAGRPVPFARVALLDEDDGRWRGSVGEIAVRGRSSSPDTGICPRTRPGPSGAAGTTPATWGASTPTATSSTPAQARQGAHQAGRENVYPAEVETAILQHPDVERAVVSASPTPGGRKPSRPSASSSRPAAGRGRLIASSAAGSPPSKNRATLEFVAAMPLAADGSPDRKKIKDAHGGASG